MWTIPQFEGGEAEAGTRLQWRSVEDGHHSLPELMPCCASVAVNSA